MSIKKTFFPEKGVCRVIFSLPDSLVDHVKKVAIVGDFNDWHPEKHPRTWPARAEAAYLHPA